MLFNVSNASVFKKEGGVEKEVKSENCEHQLSFILKIEKTNLEKDKNPPNYSSPYFRFFTYMARLSKRAPFLLFSSELASNSPGVFFFLLFHFVFERGRRGNGSVEKTIFLFFFALLFFFGKIGERESEEKLD